MLVKTSRSVKVSRTLIGAVIIFLFYLITNNLIFLVASIICTAGISLVVYLPLAYILGSVAEKLMQGLFKEGTKQDVVGEVKNNDQKALENFILKSNACGVLQEEIIKQLIQSGWQKQEIINALNDIEKEAS
ncbi:MAG: hypothetical protein Q7T79_01495 [bacterium]|nr:hypothetical protein [bacterium]